MSTFTLGSLRIERLTAVSEVPEKYPVAQGVIAAIGLHRKSGNGFGTLEMSWAPTPIAALSVMAY